MMHASEEEWDVQQDAVIFFSHLMRLRSQIDRKSFADKTGRVVKSTSLRLGSIMKRAHCAKQLEFSHEAVSLPQLFHFNKRLAHVFLALLGRDLRKLHYKMHPSTQPPCFSSVSEAEIYPPLHNRTDEYTEVTLDAPTIDAVSRSECALGVKDLFYDAQVENSMVGGGLPPDGASAADIYGSGTFKISIQELKRVSKSARVAVGSVLPPAFLEGLVWAMCGTGAAHGRDFFSLRRNIPLKEICCENRINALKQFHFDVLCSAEMHLATLNAANNAEAKTADTLEGTALRSAIFTAEENLKQSERNVASLDNLKQNNALEYEVDNFLKKVKHDPVAYGFPCASKVNECITRPLSVLCESMCTSTEGYSFVDGCSQRYNQIIAKTPESFALFGVSRLADTQCASVDIVSLRVRLRIQYRLLMNLAKFHKVEYISSVVTFAEPPFGVSMSSLREASLKALLDVLCSDGGGSHNASTPFLHLQCWYLYCESEAAKLECQTILDRHKSQSSKQLRANIILHERDPKFLAVELCKRGCATALIYGTDINELLLGHPGGSWEEGRGNSGFGLKEDIAATTTLLLNSSAIVGREHFLAERILYEDTEGWNETRLSDITERISFEEKQQQQQQQRLQPKTQPEQKPKPAASVATPTPAPTATMVSLTYQEESCIVEVSSLTDALSIARESFEALSAIDEALFYLAYFYGEKRRGIKSDRHFNTFVSLALKSAVRMDGDIPELEVVQRKRAKQNSKSEKHSKEKPERQKRAKEVAAPPEEVEEVNTEAVPPPPPALPIPQTAPPDPEEAKQEVKKCKGRLSELLKEQEEFEELKEWKKEHAEVEIRAVVGANAPILKKTIVLNRRELSSLDTLIPVIHGEISYNPDIFFYERGDMVAITSDAILQTFIAERWDCLLFFTKPKRLVSLRPLKPTPDEESAIITMTFNPPTLRVVGCVEQCTVYAISDTVATVLAPTALHGCVGGGIRKGRAKRKVELHFEALPQPHWGATYSNIFCDQTTQSVLFSSVLDAMYDTGGWVMNDTSSCTCPVEVPRYVFYIVHEPHHYQKQTIHIKSLGPFSTPLLYLSIQ